MFFVLTLLFRLLFSSLSLSLSLSLSSFSVSLCLSLSLSVSLSLSFRVMLCVVLCGVVVLLVVVVCVLCVMRHAEKTWKNPYVDSDTPLCVHSIRPRACWHHAHMCFNMCAWCGYTRVRFVCTHGRRVGIHTRRSSPSLLTKKRSRRGLTWPREIHQRNPWILHIFSLRNDREQHVPDSSNHSLSLIKLTSFSNLEGSFGGNQQPDGSICLFPPPPTQHNTHNTHNTKRQKQRQRDRDKTQVPRTICTSDTFHDVRLKSL